MNEAQVHTVEQVRQVLEGTQALQFRAAEDDEGRYQWIDAVLRRLDYRQLQRAERGAVLAYLQRLSGYGRAQVTRLVSRARARLCAVLHSRRRAGSAFAAIPAQNATGNWIRVVQRLPVRIRLDASELEARPLKVGLSMTARIDTRSGK